MKKAFARLTLICSLLAVGPRCVGQTQPLTPEVKKQTIDRLSELLPERYAYKEIAQRLSQLLQQNLRAGKYDRHTSPTDFSLAVTDDLRSLNTDRHLALNYSPEAPAAGAAAGAPAPPVTPEERARRASEFNRQMNYGFRAVQFFNGNVCRLKFDYFDAFLAYSGPAADAAMASLKNCDAVIIDLRENTGGGSDMVAHLAGFFFKERTLLGTSYNRLTDSAAEEFVTPQPKEKQLADADLYVLTSRATVSAAEALAYTLKYLRRAKVVGETSAGAANPGRVTRINSLFTAFIPNRHFRSVVTGTSWEGTGVPVDIPCPAEDALRVARLEALKGLRRRAAAPARQKSLDDYITFLERVNPEREPPEKVLRRYVGEYQGGRAVELKKGRLYYSRLAEVGGRLYFISGDVFMLSEGGVTITFKRDGRGRVVGMEYRWSLSDTPAAAAKVK